MKTLSRLFFVAALGYIVTWIFYMFDVSELSSETHLLIHIFTDLMILSPILFYLYKTNPNMPLRNIASIYIIVVIFGLFLGFAYYKWGPPPDYTPSDSFLFPVKEKSILDYKYELWNSIWAIASYISLLVIASLFISIMVYLKKFNLVWWLALLCLITFCNQIYLPFIHGYMDYKNYIILMNILEEIGSISRIALNVVLGIYFLPKKVINSNILIS